ncbi:hypothetical protein [Enterococcus phage MDA2]|uniref:Uncharacterized protein n=1 Tax=Enterococcus phage MDA2 TaxID=2816459 RepID=A0AAE7RKJ3_9CAUD|nr:hypothetical protein [Enterococcus phage MDA2]
MRHILHSFVPHIFNKKNLNILLTTHTKTDILFL